MISFTSGPLWVSSGDRFDCGDHGALRRLNALHVRIYAVQNEERLVRSLFDQLGVLDDEDDVRMPDRAAVMSDDDRRSPLHQGIQGSDHGLFGGGIQTGGRKLKDVDKRGNWDWFDNPFAGKETLNGLRV